jgi:diguanylate cyclase (GGDEF)-like protein
VLVLPKPIIDHVDFFAVDAGGRTQQIRTGDAHPFSSRPVAYRGFAFLLDAKPGETVTYYLHLRSATGAIGLPLKLVDSATFRAESASENYLRGTYIGFMAGLALCALVLFILVRNVAYAYYCQYLVTFVLLVCAVDGYGMQFLWPNAPLAQQILPAALLALSNITGVLFTRSFLNLPVATPSCEPMYAVGVIASAVGIGLHVFQGGFLGVTAIMAASAILCPIAMWGCLQAWRGGDRIAGYLLLGWLAFMLGMSLTLLDMSGVLPSSWWTVNGIYFGSLGEFVALAVGLSERLWTTQRAREAQIAAVNADLAELNSNLESMVQTRTHQLEARNRELSELAVRDSLTGLYNHSTSIELLEQLLSQSQRYEFPIATVMLDIDNFKQLNDSFGHQLGDHVLEEVSQTLADSVRGSDVVGRYGGEEFLIVMPYADAQAAREYGERVLALIREIHIEDNHISASIGISVFHPRGHRASAQDVIRRADEALYRSKRDGRDRLTVDSMSLVVSRDGDRRYDKPPPRS